MHSRKNNRNNNRINNRITKVSKRGNRMRSKPSYHIRSRHSKRLGLIPRAMAIAASSGALTSGSYVPYSSNSNRLSMPPYSGYGFNISQRYPTGLTSYRGPTEVGIPEEANLFEYTQPEKVNNMNNMNNQQPNVNKIVREEIKEHKKDLSQKERAELSKIIRDGFGIKKMEIKGKKQRVKVTVTYKDNTFTVRKPNNYKKGQWLKVPKTYAISRLDGQFETQLNIGGKSKNFLYVKWL